MDKINLDSNVIDEVYMGNVISSGLGQAPAKQAAYLLVLTIIPLHYCK